MHGLKDRVLALLVWVSLTTVSVLLGFQLLRILINPASGKGNLVVNAMMGVGVFGILIPLAQWAVIRAFLPKAIVWLVASLTGLLVAAGIDLGLSLSGIYPINLFARIALAVTFGAVIGSAQAVYLHRHVTNAWLWIAASASGWGLLTLTTGAVVDGMFEEFLVGMIPAAITGVALAFFVIPTRHGSFARDSIAA